MFIVFFFEKSPGGGGQCPHLNFHFSSTFRSYRRREERNIHHRSACSFCSGLLHRFTQSIKSETMLPIVTEAFWSMALKTLAFLASQIFQQMVRAMEGQTSRGSPSGRVDSQRSENCPKDGAIPILSQTARADGQVKNRCSRSSTGNPQRGHVA